MIVVHMNSRIRILTGPILFLQVPVDADFDEAIVRSLQSKTEEDEPVSNNVGIQVGIKVPWSTVLQRSTVLPQQRSPAAQGGGATPCVGATTPPTLHLLSMAAPVGSVSYTM
jgi:hypothetical protein